jgi:hypothetical protein
MSQFLSDQLDFFGKQAHSETWHQEHDAAMICRDVEDAVAFAIQLKERIDRMAECDPKLRRGKWTEEAARVYVPWYQRWYEHAGLILGAVRGLKKQGYMVVGTAAFMKAYLRAKLFAVDFEETLAALKRIEAGQSGGIPLEEAIRELQRRDESEGHP